jgi:phosphomevalonate kinase
LQYQDFAAFKEQCMHMLTFAEWPVEDVLTSAEWLYSKDPQSGFLLLEKATVKFPENDEILWYLVEWEKE